MNKMLNTATSMASYHKFSSSSSSSSTPTKMGRNLRGGGRGFNCNNDNDDIYITSDLIGTDYFVSSLDFEYDLFLNGLVNCDNSGYRNRIRHHKDLYDFSLIDAQKTNNNYRDDMNRWPPKELQHPTIKSAQDSSSSPILFATTTDNLFAALNSPLSRATTAYRHLQRPQRQHAISNDYTVLSFGQNNNRTNNTFSNYHSSQQQQSNSTNQINQTQVISTSITSNITNGKIKTTVTLSTNNNSTGNLNGNPMGNSNIALGKCNTNGQMINGNTGSNTTATVNVINSTNSLINQSGGKIENPLDQKISSLATTTMMSDHYHHYNHQQSSNQTSTTLDSNENVVDISPSDNNNLSHQHLHALHRFRQQRKKGLIGRLRDVVISFTPKARCSVVNRVGDIYSRYGKEEKDTLAEFNFLNDDIDKLTQSMNEEGEVKEQSCDDENFDLEMEEYDLIHPFYCDTTTTNTIALNDEYQEVEQDVVEENANYSNKKPSDKNSSKVQIQICKSNSSGSDEDQFGQQHSQHESACLVHLSSTSSPSLLKANHSIKLQKFCRFGFPRKSSSLEFQSTMKRLDEEIDQLDDPESISGSHSVQETLQTNINRINYSHEYEQSASKSVNNNNNEGSKTTRYFLVKNSSFSTSSLSNSAKKKSRSSNNKKKPKNKISSTMTTATTAISE